MLSSNHGWNKKRRKVMSIPKRKVGQWVHQLCLLSKAEKNYWWCACACGRLTRVHKASLCETGKGKRTCGCINASKIHGLTGTPEYRIWKNMMSRCFNPHTKYWHLYGGRGIAVCDRWRTSVANFVADMGPRPSLKHSIDRIDPNGSYTPENCRWATQVEQGNNMRTTRHVTIGNETHCLREWTRILKVPIATLHGRLNRWNHALKNLPVKRKCQMRQSRQQVFRTRHPDHVGVYYAPVNRKRPWYATFRKAYVGAFETPEAAAAARQAAVDKFLRQLDEYERAGEVIAARM